MARPAPPYNLFQGLQNRGTRWRRLGGDDAEETRVQLQEGSGSMKVQDLALNLIGSSTSFPVKSVQLPKLGRESEKSPHMVRPAREVRSPWGSPRWGENQGGEVEPLRIPISPDRGRSVCGLVNSTSITQRI